jgi:hypothetical protein
VRGTFFYEYLYCTDSDILLFFFLLAIVLIASLFGHKRLLNALNVYIVEGALMSAGCVPGHCREVRRMYTLQYYHIFKVSPLFSGGVFHTRPSQGSTIYLTVSFRFVLHLLGSYWDANVLPR